MAASFFFGSKHVIGLIWVALVVALLLGGSVVLGRRVGCGSCCVMENLPQRWMNGVFKHALRRAEGILGYS